MTQRPLTSGWVGAVLATLLLVAVGIGGLALAARGPGSGAHGAAPPPVAFAGQVLTNPLSIPTAPPITPTTPATPAVSATPVITDPMLLLDPFLLYARDLVLQEARVDLGGGKPGEVLLTLSSNQPVTNTAGQVETQTVSSLAAIRYDPTVPEWSELWRSPGVPGRAQVLPGQQPGTTRVYQSGNLLRASPPQPILLLRTYQAPTATVPTATVRLALWAWTGQTAVPLHMITPAGADQEAVFSGSTDVQTADLDDDGVIEVIVDDGPASTIYRWDAGRSRFVVRQK